MASLAKGTSLGRIPLPTDQEAVASYLSKIAASGWNRDVLHPGMLLESANWVLMANVVLPPWKYVESSITHLRPVRIGETVEVHSVVDDEWERKGHRFVRLNVAWRAADSGTSSDATDDVVAVARHVAIWKPAIVA